jgi:hypothetical protein
MKVKAYKTFIKNIIMPRGAENKAILKANRFLIIQRLMAHKKIGEIANEIGVGYDTLYTYLATGEILHDE